MLSAHVFNLLNHICQKEKNIAPGIAIKILSVIGPLYTVICLHLMHKETNS